MENKLNTKIYAGIGSRQTPDNVCDLMVKIASFHAKKGNKLRTGAADGADSAFIHGHYKETRENIEIYIPWDSFNGFYDRDENVYSGCCYKSKSIASEYHPRWETLPESVKMLMARNTYQVLGKNLRTPVDFVLCWTPFNRKGDPVGGTSQAIRIAKAYDIPVINLGYQKVLNEMKELVKELD